MQHFPYIGSGPYCYANAFAMMGTFYFQVRHANDFNGFPLEILECPDA
ncbi:hypothetical protein GOB24_03085, partial [Sinorhizobium meliloti]|nr:hypothetical protein [Sinorhizobium meliloti]